MLSHTTWELSYYHLWYRDFPFYNSNLGFYQYTRGLLWWMWHTWSIWEMALSHHIPTITKALHALHFGGKTYSISTSSLNLHGKLWVTDLIVIGNVNNNPIIRWGVIAEIISQKLIFLSLPGIHTCKLINITGNYTLIKYISLKHTQDSLKTSLICMPKTTSLPTYAPSPASFSLTPFSSCYSVNLSPGIWLMTCSFPGYHRLFSFLSTSELILCWSE